MKKKIPIYALHYWKIMLLFLLLCSTFNQISAQQLKGELSKKQLYEAAVAQAQQDGTFDGFVCGVDTKDSDDKEKAACPNPCTQLTAGYGTNCWTPANDGGGSCANIDPACTIPNIADGSCTSGKYRVPLNIIIFENSAWTGDNYLGGTGFASLADADITAKVAELNSLYANANVEFYEVNRQRVTNPDLYDFYDNIADPASGDNDGTDDLSQTQAYDILDVINLYFVGGLDNDHDCCGALGFAPYPCSRDYSIMRYGAAVGGSTLSHELGHYFGLHHTHRKMPINSITGDNDNTNQPSGMLDNCDCRTTGDGICDTWPSPRLSFNCSSGLGACTGLDNYCFISDVFPRCDFDAVGFGCYAVANSLPITSLTINPNAGENCGNGVSTILQENIMSYNFYGGCRTDFSPCQYRKIHDVLLGCRSYLCSRDVTQEFASTTINDVNSPYQEICLGDAIPTFTAVSACYRWYDSLGDGATELASGTTFTPTSAQIDVNTVGVYTFYLGDANEYNTDCRTPITITVLAEAGTGSGNTMAAVAVNNCSSAQNIALDTDATQFNENGVIGWWITETNPIANSITDDATLATALGATTVNSTLANPVNNLIEATSGTPQTALSLAFDCSTLDATETYYATPMMASSRGAIPEANCQVTNATANNIAFNSFPGKFNSIDPDDICRPSVLNGTPTFTVCVTVTGYTGDGNELSIIIRDDNTNGSTLVLSWQGGIGDGNGTYCYTETDMLGYDPSDPSLTTGMTVIVWEETGTGMQDATISTTLDITFAATPEIPFPSVTDYNDCLFGTPITLTCACPICPTIASLSDPADVCENTNFDLTASGLATMAMSDNSTQDYGIGFVHYGAGNAVPADSYIGGTSLGNVAFASLTGTSPNQSATLTNIGGSLADGTYQICAILTPTPADATCRPNQCVEVIINNNPTPNFSTTDTQVCENETNVAYTLSTTYANHDWTLGGQTAIASGGTNSDNTVSVNWGATGSGSVAVTVTDANGCIGSVTENVTINANPTPSFSTTDIQVCENETNVTYTLSNTYASYVWNITGGAIASGGTNSDNTVSVNWGATGSGSVAVTVTDANGCNGSVTENVTINANPTPSFSTTDNQVCENETNVTYTLSNTYASYVWNITGGAIASGGTASDNTVSVNWGANGSGSVIVTVTDANGCNGNVTENVTINANPTPNFSTTDAQVCENETNVTYTLSNTYAAYAWNITGGAIASGGTNSDNTVSVNWGVTGSGSVAVTVTDANNCIGSVTENVTINANPTPSFSTTDTQVCENETNVTYTLSNTYASHVWNITGGAIASGGTASDNTVSVNWGAIGSGSVMVTVTDANGCNGNVTENVTINSNPAAPTFASTDVLVCENETNITYTLSTTYAAYNWTIVGGAIASGGTNSDNTVSVNWGTNGIGSVAVIITDANGCQSNATENITIEVCCGPDCGNF
ncbi:MAG: hypothetical protein ACPG5B_09035 [Chitinophagales bacterium]